MRFMVLLLFSVWFAIGAIDGEENSDSVSAYKYHEQ